MPEQLTFSEHWDFYPSYMGDKHFSVRYDVGAAALSQDERAKYPHILVIQVPFLDAREDGFPTRNEMERINRIEDSLDNTGLDIRHIGVLTGDSCSRFIFCCAASVQDFSVAAESLMKHAGQCDYGFQRFENDLFGYYNNVLAPNPLEQNWIANRNVCYNLEQHGETFTKPRPIDFYFYFGDEQELREIADILSGHSFLIAGRDTTEDGLYMLHLTLEDIPSLPRITEITEFLLDVIEDKNCYFDGWGCAAIGKEIEA